MRASRTHFHSQYCDCFMNHNSVLCVRTVCVLCELLVRLIVPTSLLECVASVCFVRLTRWLLFPLLTPWCSMFLNTVHKSSQSACFWPPVAPPTFGALQPHPLCSDWLPTMDRPHPLWGEDKEVQNSWIKSFDWGTSWNGQIQIFQ